MEGFAGALGWGRGRETGRQTESSSGGDTAAHVRADIKHRTLEAAGLCWVVLAHAISVAPSYWS